jgi:predicted Kef-type K+ transport protein
VVAASTIVLVRGTKELIESVRGRTTVGLRVESASFEDHLIIVSRIVRRPTLLGVVETDPDVLLRNLRKQ